MKDKNPDAYYIVIGDDERVEEIIEKLTDKYRISEFDKKTLYSDTITPEVLLQELQFLPVFSEKKLIILKNIEAIKKSEWKTILDYLKNPYSHVCLILTGKSAKISLSGYAAFVHEKEKTPEEEIFSSIYHKNFSTKDFVLLLSEYLLKKEKGFTLVIAAAEHFLRKRILGERKLKREIVEKFLTLHQLDFNLKTGRIAPEKGLEFFSSIYFPEKKSYSQMSVILIFFLQLCFYV